MEEKTYTDISTITVGEALDRLEVPVGKIGLNSAQQSIALLNGLDAVYARLQEITPESQSRKVTEVQFEGIVAKLKTEAARFLRDLGGAQALQRERQRVNPPRDHEWWYLDELVVDRQKKALRRTLTIGGAVLAVLVVLALVYNTFLAPDPKVAAVYGYQSSAHDKLMAGDFDAALVEVDQGLKVDPVDAGLLITRGVVLDIQGKTVEAEQSFSAARQGTAGLDEFYVTRGQVYLMAQQAEKALTDAQEAIKVNPKSAHAYLLSGQVYETIKDYDAALTDYDKAFELSNAGNQPELAAMVRMRTAMLLQTMNMQMPSLQPQVTPSPTE